MFGRSLIVVAFSAILLGYGHVPSAEAIPAFARQYDLQCNACHTRPPRLNRFGDMVHMSGFQIPSAARLTGLVGSLKEEGTVRTILNSLALRAEGGLLEYSESPRETEVTLAPPDEITLFISHPLTTNLSFFVEIEGEPNAVEFEDGRFFTKGQIGLGKEAFFMANIGRVLELFGVPTMEMGGTMGGYHGEFTIHGPMVMGGKVDPSTNFSYPTNRQMLPDTETEVEHGEVERFPVVPYAFTSKFFGLFKNRDEGEPQLVTDQVMYNTPGAPGADLHAMFQSGLFLGQVGFLRENEGFNTYTSWRVDLGERKGFNFSASVLANGGFGVVRAPDPDDHDRPGGRRLDRLRYGLAANARWKAFDVYGALIWDHVFDVPGGLRDEFDRTATGLTLEVDYLAHETVMLSARFDQLWAGGLKDEKRDGSVLSAQVKYYPWQNVAFFVRDSVNLRGFIEENPLRSWRNQLFAGIDWDF